MQTQYTYSISETENLVFVGTESSFELYSKAESCTQELIARFSAGKWRYDNLQQRQLFLTLFNQNRMAFYRALKGFLRSMHEKPKMYEFKCVRRKFNIRVSKLRENTWQTMYNIFYNK